jgi:FdhD protein
MKTSSKQDPSKEDLRPKSTQNGKNEKGIQPIEYISIGYGSPKSIEGRIVEEALICISVNGKELATFMCTPKDLDLMALGFLFNEGLIESIDDVDVFHISQSNCVDIWLKTDFEPPERLIVTAGCGGGVTFDDLSKQHNPLNIDTKATVDQLITLMRETHLGATLYQRSRGIHTAALANHDKVLLQVEDLGRHNCIDKLCGAALINNISTRERILLSSGRISSEMINKARRLETPIICSRTSPTSLSVALAKIWNISIVAYLRQNKMRIYSHPERIVL